MPTGISSASLARSITEAGKLTASAKSRHTGNFGGGRCVVSMLVDPAEPEEEDMADNLELWRLLPQLKNIPEALLRKLPLSAMFQLNNALGKEKKTTARLGVNTKLAHNAKELVSRPATVDRGVDNRRDILHPARFLGGG